MAELTRLEAALLTVPADIVSVLVAYGADQAMCWIGYDPGAKSEFYVELGARIRTIRNQAWDKELNRAVRYGRP